MTPTDLYSPERLAHRSNLLQLIQMRWMAVAGQLLTIFVAHMVLGIALPLFDLLALLGLLTLFNLASWWRYRWTYQVSNAELFAGLLVDVCVLTGLLYFSGGGNNPFIFLFLLQVVVGAELLKPKFVWTLVALTGLAFVSLTQWYHPLVLPDAKSHMTSTYYVAGLLLSFLVNAAMLVFFIGRIGRNLRRRDASLAALNQRAVEEEHIVRMGLLASGAAHELGTPLATLSVILGDWARMAPFAAEPELREEIEQMQVQVNRCKSIVTGILQSAGETRGDSPQETSLHDFFDELVQAWQQTRPCQSFVFDHDALTDVPIISDTAMKQMIDNVLDNALEAAPGGTIRMVVACDNDILIVQVFDEGPGFSPTMLQRFGKPYESSKGRPGGGLGLFLSVNVARKLGGSIEALNRPMRGAEVRITLPLSALMPSE